jgi:hypothetical protein
MGAVTAVLQIPAVAVAVEPPLQHRFGGRVPEGDVLRRSEVRDARGPQPIERRPTFRGRVAEIVPPNHVVDVRLCDPGRRAIPAQRTASDLGPMSVGEPLEVPKLAFRSDFDACRIRISVARIHDSRRAGARERQQ